jgi:hypothetical protein
MLIHRRFIIITTIVMVVHVVYCLRENPKIQTQGRRKIEVVTIESVQFSSKTIEKKQVLFQSRSSLDSLRDREEGVSYGEALLCSSYR